MPRWNKPSWSYIPGNQKSAVALYRDQSRNLTSRQIADILGSNQSQVALALRLGLPPEEYEHLKLARLDAARRSPRKFTFNMKRGDDHRLRKNPELSPSFGKRGAAHHLWKGVNSEMPRRRLFRYFGFRPCNPMDVHHIDRDTKNQAWDNLALLSRVAHNRLHAIIDRRANGGVQGRGRTHIKVITFDIPGEVQQNIFEHHIGGRLPLDFFLFAVSGNSGTLDIHNLGAATITGINRIAELTKGSH